MFISLCRSALTRLQLLLPVAIAYLAAAGAGFVARRRFVAMIIAVLVAADLGVFAGRFYPFLDPRLALPPQTPTIAFLQAQPKPFRVAPMFDYLWPNSSELYRLEDVRRYGRYAPDRRYQRRKRFRQMHHDRRVVRSLGNDLFVIDD